MRCPDCGLRFESNMVRANPGDTVTVHASDNWIRCRRCGGTAEQEQHGTWLVGEGGEWRLLASALRPADATLDDYQRLADTLREAQQREDLTAQDLADAVRRIGPKFQALADWMLSPRGVAVGQWLSVLLAVVTLIVTVRGPGEAAPAPESATSDVSVTVNEGPSDEQVRDWIEEAVAAEQATSSRSAREQPKNSPCQCGSGRKYKRCHGGPGR